MLDNLTDREIAEMFCFIACGLSVAGLAIRIILRAFGVRG